MFLLDRYKVPFYHHKFDGKWGYLVSKDGQTRRTPFRVKLNKLNKLTTIKSTTITVWTHFWQFAFVCVSICIYINFPICVPYKSNTSYIFLYFSLTLPIHFLIVSAFLSVQYFRLPCTFSVWTLSFPYKHIYKLI